MQEKDIKILYIQIREDQATRQEEFVEFVRYSGLAENQFHILNVFDTPKFSPQEANNFDAVFVGGSSDASVLEIENFPFVIPLKELLAYCVEIDKPVFASCFGFQAVVEALGGEVILDKENLEMGTYKLTLTEAAKEDILFHDTPQVFEGVSGHKERAGTLPENVTMLAYSELCPYHAIKINDKPFYAFQFHPELDKEDLVPRLMRYKERYFDEEGAIQKIIDGCKDTPEANKLVRKFVERILLK